MAGRKKGVPNKATAEFREALNGLLNKSAPKFEAWMESIEDPARRFDVICKLAEYAYPKLGRTEVTGNDGGPLTVEIVKYSGGAE